MNKQSVWDYEAKEGDGGKSKQGYKEKKIPAAAISMSCSRCSQPLPCTYN